MIEIGTPEQKERFVGRILRGEMLWCQGFSEPNAGSDLASVQTKAVLEGDEWVINGQKIWSSDAPYADWCTLLARTHPEAPKHKGMTMLAVPMSSSGVTVRPIKQINGRSEFGEIFFDNVRVPRDAVIGELQTGWNVTMRMLTYERGLYTLVEIPRFEKAWRQEVEYAKNTRRGGQLLIDDPKVREQLAQSYAYIQMMRLTNLRYISRYLRGAAPGEESSLMKLHWATTDQGLYDLGMALGGPSVAGDARGAARNLQRPMDGRLFLLARLHHLRRHPGHPSQPGSRAHLRPPPLNLFPRPLCYGRGRG